MRDTGDMMEDALSEDTMMECSGDEALYDLIDLSTGISRSAPTIKEAAERLLTLLGVEDDEEELLSSSEDEGVELDEGSDEDEDDELENTRLLHQLAASLAQELKYSHKQSPASILTRQCGVKTHHIVTRDYQTDDQIQCMEIAQENSYQEAEKSQKLISSHVDQSLEYTRSSGQGFFGASTLEVNATDLSTKFRSEIRLKSNGDDQNEEKSFSAGEVSSWAAGWDACAAEAVRYLLEDEGLSPHHPTVLAMKNHLEIQRERAVAQYSM